MFKITKFHLALTGVVAFFAVALIASEVDARAGKSGGSGSRGSRTYSAPAPTQTAPNAAAPINRTATTPQQAQRPATVGQGAAAPAGGMFNRPGLMGGLMAGFLGAGLIGLLLGNGALGGLGGMASMFGLLLQIGLVLIVAKLAWSWWQRRNAGANAYATAGGPALRDIGNNNNDARGPAYGGGSGVPLAPVTGGEVAISEEDFNIFERRLTDVQAAYSAEDLGKLRALATPEMVSYFAEDLADNASRGVVNQVADIKLLQGDMSEAWSENGTEYATVAMRYGLTDVTVERASGKVVEGSREPQEATELWTFMRARGGEWMLSAIQQA